ncbi:MAG TPA: hypothetical protein VF060_33160 [Trebonia sp.]
MMRKAAVVLVPLIAVGAAVATQWTDISRYLKIERMSFGDGKPGNVPATGTKRYPDGPGKGVPDGTGSFDSASRGGGPAASPQHDGSQPADRSALARDPRVPPGVAAGATSAAWRPLRPAA